MNFHKLQKLISICRIITEKLDITDCVQSGFRPMFSKQRKEFAVDDWDRVYYIEKLDMFFIARLLRAMRDMESYNNVESA